MSGFTVFAGIAGWVLVLASLWIVYTKASEPGWATLVPFFNLYVLMRIVGRPGWWVVLYFVPLVNIVIYIIVTADLAHSFGKGDGFAVGLLVDLALLQTLGMTSLIFTLVGYWSGRLRELRDPQAPLTPLLVGAAATAASLVGYSLMEFLLGVDAPVSLELLRQIVLGVAVNSLVALPMWAIVRRSLEGGMPEDPRRRRRRAYTTGGLSPLSRP